MTAGSRCTAFAAMGSRPPRHLETITVTSSERLTARATAAPVCGSKSRMRPKLTAASAAPHSRLTASSLFSTRSASRGRISPSARPRMTRVEDWEPQLPPVSMSMGMNAASTTTEESTSWKPLMMPPVNVAEIMSTSSQTMRFFARAKGLVLR